MTLSFIIWASCSMTVRILVSRKLTSVLLKRFPGIPGIWIFIWLAGGAPPAPGYVAFTVGSALGLIFGPEGSPLAGKLSVGSPCASSILRILISANSFVGSNEKACRYALYA